MNMTLIRRVTPIMTLLLIGGLWTPAQAERRVLDAKSPSQKKESLIWDVHQQITRIQVDILDGRPIVNTVKLLGGQEFPVGAYLEKGKNWQQEFGSPVAAGQVRVNVDKAQGSRLQLIVWTAGKSTARSGANATSKDAALKRPSQKKESLVWEVHDAIRGFEVFVTEGNPIINTVKVLGGQEFSVGAYVAKGHSFRKDFDRPVQVGQLRVNVDKAQGSELKLVLRK